jgi:hypothetical protein
MVEVDDMTGRWILLDKRSGTKWPSTGMARSGIANWLEGNCEKAESVDKDSLRLRWRNGSAFLVSLAEEGGAPELRFEGNTSLDEAHRVRVFHAFGPPTIRWTKELYKMEREGIIGLGD